MAWNDPRTWVAGEIVTASMMNLHVRDNFRMLYHELTVVEITSDVSVSPELAWNDFTGLTTGAITFKGSPVRLKLTAPLITMANADSSISLRTNLDGSAHKILAAAATGGLNGSTLNVETRFTPSSGSHTVKIQGNPGNGTGADNITIHAGTGTGGTDDQARLTVWERGG